ncbi:hypothetical protein JNUCC64_24160 [Streptomyces sp. JNUCC 64]
MRATTLLSPPATGVPGRALALLTALATALLTVFVIAPRPLAGIGPGIGFASRTDLTDAVRETFAGYWGAGRGEFSPGLEQVVDYWFRYHVAKALIAAALLVVFAALGALLWRTFLRAAGPGKGGRAALASSGGLVTALALLSLATLMANVQGATAPFASLLPTLASGRGSGESSEALDQARRALDESLSAGTAPPPALASMISDFARFHVAMAVMAAVVAVVLAVIGAVAWRRFAATAASERRARRTRAVSGGLAVLVSLVAVVVAVANTTTAADPGPALLAFFEGGW